MGAKIIGGVSIGGRPTGQPTPDGQPLPAQYNVQGVDFDRDAFTAALQSKGYDVTWESATLCPNRGGLLAKDHPITCTICEGNGWIYFDATQTQMLITSVTMQQNYLAQGGWSNGRVMVTALPEHRLNPFDRLTLCNGVARFTEVLRRQPQATTDRPKYAPLCASYVAWVNRSSALQTFTQDVDFTITDGRIEWPSATQRPDDGTYYTIAYTYRPRYVVGDLTHQHRESTVGGRHYEFPVSAIARLDYLTRDESKDAPEVDFQDPFVIRQ